MSTKKNIFQTDILIQVSDINYGGHLGNDRFLTLAQEVRVRWLRSFGWSEKNIDQSQSGFLVKEAHIKYHQEAFLGDVIDARLSIAPNSQCSCWFYYELYNKESQKLIGSISTKVAFFNYENRTVSKVPHAIKIILEGKHE